VQATLGTPVPEGPTPADLEARARDLEATVEPDRWRPDESAVRRTAEKARRGEPLSTQEVDLLLKAAIFTVREELAQNRAGLRADDVCGACADASRSAMHALRDLGIDVDAMVRHQATRLFHDGGEDTGATNHAFMVVQMPDGRRYLI